MHYLLIPFEDRCYNMRPVTTKNTHRKMLFRIILVAFLIFLFGSSSAQIPGRFYYDGKEVINLKGKWNFVPNQFLTVDQVIADTSRIFVDVPGDWNSAQINGQPFSSKGYGTYYARIDFEPNADLSELAVNIPEVGIAYRVFVDDKEVGSVGVPGTSKEEEVAEINEVIFDLPSLQGQSTYLIFHISNFRYSFGGLFYTPAFGKEQTIRVAKERLTGIKLLVLGTVIILTIYMLYVYFRLRKERFRLFFAIICFILLLHTLTSGDMLILDIIPDIHWAVLKKLAFTSFFLVAATNGMFFLELFPNYFNRKLIQWFSVVSLIVAFFTILAPASIGAYLVFPFQIITIIAGSYYFERLIRATYDNIDGARFLLFGFLLAFIASLNDILNVLYIINTPQLAHLGMFAYILTLTMIMAMKYINALKKNESITESLMLSNEYLERNVEDRTKKLKQKNVLIDSKNKELEKALQEQEDLMAVVAHDLKAPFNQIEQLSELIMEEVKLKKEQVSYVELILKVTENARNVIENLVFIRSYQSESQKPKLKSFDPRAFFEAKVAAFQNEAAKKNITIEHGQSIKSKKMRGDESALDRIVDNLLSNAIKFSPTDSKIVFEMLEESNEFVFRIKDYGQGFSGDDRKNLFKKFQKLSAKPTAGELSTGLGLSIVKTLVEELEGEIKLFSEKGKGAEFIVNIPKKEEAKPVSV